MFFNKGSNKINLSLRFILELSALFAFAFWGWKHDESIIRYPLAFGLPILAASIWGIFNVPGDPSRSGKAPVKVPGILRIIIELSIFGLAFLVLLKSGYISLAIIFVSLVILHYIFSIDRIKWLITSKSE